MSQVPPTASLLLPGVLDCVYRHSGYKSLALTFTDCETTTDRDHTLTKPQFLICKAAGMVFLRNTVTCQCKKRAFGDG